MRVRLVSLLAVAVVVGCVVAAEVTAPPAESSAPARVVEPVQTAALVCPVLLADAPVTSVAAAAVPPGLPGGDLPGSGALSVLAATPGALVVPLQASGRPIVLDTARTPAAVNAAVVAQAVGGLAPGLGADQASASTDWFARTPCEPGVTDAWLVGGGSKPGRRAVVVLVNAQDAVAQVDLVVYGPGGPVAAPGGRGLVVPASSRVQVALDAIAPGLESAAVHAVVRVGRVGVSMLDHEVDGSIERGVDWVPQAVAPARRVTVPAIPAGIDSVLSVVVPGPQDAQFKVQAVTPSGALVPVGLEGVEAPAGRVTSIDVTAALARGFAGLVITSDQPLTAAVRFRLERGNGKGEVSYTAAAAALGPQSGPAVVTALSASASERLLVTTGDRGATLRLQTFARAGDPPAPVGIEIPARRTVAVTLVAPPEAALYATSIDVVTGEAWLGLSSVRRTDTGIQVSGGPLRASRVTVAVPPVQPDLAIALPSAD